MQPSNANPYTNRQQYIDALTGLIGDTGTILAVKIGKLTSVDKPMGKSATASPIVGITTPSVVELKLMEFLYNGRPWLENKGDFDDVVHKVVNKVGLKINNNFTVNQHSELNTLIGLLYDEKVNKINVDHSKYKKVCNDYVERLKKEFETSNQVKLIRDAVKATFNTVLETPKAAAESPVTNARRSSLRSNTLGIESPISKNSPNKLKAIAHKVIENTNNNNNNNKLDDQSPDVVQPNAVHNQSGGDQLKIEGRK